MSILETGVKHLAAASETAQKLIEATVEIRTQEKIIDIQKEIVAAQQSNLSAQAEHAAMLKTISDLEGEVVKAKDWSEERSRYELQEMDSGALVYALKDGEPRSGAEHKLCPNCFENGKKSILNPEPDSKYFAPTQTTYRSHACHSCQAKYYFGAQPERQMRATPRVRSDYF